MRNKNASKRYDFVRKSNEKQDLQRTGKRVRIVQEYITYFIWQVVYEIACCIYNLLFQKNLGGKLLPIEMGIYIKLTNS